MSKKPAAKVAKTGKKAAKPAAESPRPAGRPSSYTEEIAAIVLGRMAAGETLSAICSTEGLPSAGAVKMWVIRDEPAGIRDRYAQAREFQADAIAEDALFIADNAPAEEAAKTRIRVDTRKWLASKINPAKFGDRTKVDLGDADGKPLKFTFGSDGIAWQNSLLFPGLELDEELTRTTELPQRAGILADDGQPMAKGPVDAREYPLGDSMIDVTGVTGAPESDAPDLNSIRLGYEPGATTGVSGLELAFNARLTGTPGGTLFAKPIEGGTEGEGTSDRGV